MKVKHLLRELGHCDPKLDVMLIAVEDDPDWTIVGVGNDKFL